jgi:hypothetical protein
MKGEIIMDDITASIIVACQTEGAAASINKLGFSFAMLAREALSFGQKAVAEFRVTQDAAWKFGKTFRNSMGSAEKAVTAFMDEYNLAESTARSMLTDTAQILKGMGFAEKESLKVAESISRWGVDLASFTGYAGGAQGAVQAIIASMMGENERLKSLGVVIREDSDEFRNMTEEIMRTKNVSEQHAKALAKLQLITIKAADAKGDYAAEGENFTQSVNNLNQQIKQTVSNIGEVIYEALSLNNVFGSLAEGLKNISNSWRKDKDKFIFILKEMKINVEYSFKQFGIYMRPAIDAIETLMGRFSALSEMLLKGAPFGEIAKAFAADFTTYFTPAGWAGLAGEKLGIDLNEKRMHAKYGSDEDILRENMRRIDAGIKTMVEDEYNLTQTLGQSLNKLAEKYKVEMPKFKPLGEYDFSAELKKAEAAYQKALAENEAALKKRLEKPKDNDIAETGIKKALQEAKKLQEVSGKALGSFSAADLSQQLAGSMAPAQKTADNTGKAVDVLRQILARIPSATPGATQGMLVQSVIGGGVTQGPQTLNDILNATEKQTKVLQKMYYQETQKEGIVYN